MEAELLQLGMKLSLQLYLKFEQWLLEQCSLLHHVEKLFVRCCTAGGTGSTFLFIVIPINAFLLHTCKRLNRASCWFIEL